MGCAEPHRTPLVGSRQWRGREVYWRDMDEAAFRAFLEAQDFPKEKVDRALADTSPASVISEGLQEGIVVSMKIAETTSRELRKKLAASISLVESGVAELEDVIET